MQMGPQRLLVVSGMIRKGRTAYNMPEPEDMQTMAESWQELIKDIPDSMVWSVFEQASANKMGGYMPNAGDLARVYRQDQQRARDATQSSLQTTYHSQMGIRTEEEENRRVESFQASERRRRAERNAINKNFEEMEARGEIGGHAPPAWADFMKDFGLEKLHTHAKDGEDLHADMFSEDEVLPAAPPEPEREWKDEELIEILIEKCGMDLSQVDTIQASDFARFLLQSVKPDLWSLGIVKSQWKMWKAKERKE